MKPQTTLDERLAALDDAAELGEGRVPDSVIAAVKRVLGSAGERRALSGDHTVVGFFGATGSGKSSLFNAVAGAALATAHVRRPTTSEPLAAVWNPAGAEGLLDWLGVNDRRHVEPPFAGDPALSLILLDLPDFDSVEAAHRAIAERLAGQVDVLVWVVDPQKYADAVIHRDFIAPLAEHAAVTAAVLNQVDTLPPDDIPRVVDSLRSLLRRDGIGDVLVYPASATRGDGIEAVRSMIARFAKERRAASERLAADVATAAARLDAPSIPQSVAKAATTELSRGLAAAASVDTVAQAVASSYRKRAGQVTGWPLTSWLLRLRPDPLRRLHLAVGSPKRDADLHRTSLPDLSSAQRAQASRAVRGYADAASEGLGDGWRAAIRSTANEAIEQLPGELDRAVSRTDLGARGSWWWPALGAIQWIALLAALVGVGWYLAAFLLPLWSLPGPDIPLAEIAPNQPALPVPALLIAAGVLIGILLGLLGALLGGAIGSARRSRAGRRLAREVDAVALKTVIEPIEHERDRAEAFGEAVRRARI